MKYCMRFAPNNENALGVLGYLIVVNQQVHKYQLDALINNLESIGTSIEGSVLNDIIDGKDTAIAYSTVLDAFSEESVKVQEDLLYMLLVLSQLDNVVDTKEEQMISDVYTKSKISIERKTEIEQLALNDALEYRNDNNSLFVNENMSAKGRIQLIKESFIRFWTKARGKKLTKEAADDVDYKKIIQRCAEIAKEDFSVVHPCYDQIISNNETCMQYLEEYKQGISFSNDISAEVALVVKTYLDAVQKNVIEQTQNAEASLSQKERTLPDFTISLLGRTKAGKSTLHAILTNQGYDKIGVGKQRTTKYNRVYQWNLVRIIDTPGIGSAEAAGRTDDEIAQSVLGESDVVCLVVVDDSILKDVLDLMDKVAELNKPIIILLNHKENIRNSVKYRRYLAEPQKWLNDAGESNMQGHIDRITKYAESKGYKELVSVYPVFLLAAQMSNEAEYINDKVILWKSSNVEAFINRLKNWIIYSGTIKRSQTILDEAIQIFMKSQNQIMLANEPVERHIEYLEQSRAHNISVLNAERDRTVQAVKKTYKQRMEQLANIDALNFAEEVYNQKDIADKWPAFLQRIGFEEELTSEIEQECSVFVSKADSVVRELFEDVYFKMKNEFSIPKIEVPLQVDFKSIVRLTGGALGVAGAIVLFVAGASNPVGWVITIAGILVSLAASLFSSKDKRRQNAVNKIHQSIKKSILESLNKQTDKAGECVAQELSKQINNVDKLYIDLIDGLNSMRNQSGIMSNKYLSQIDWLNRVYAWRIVQFLNKDNEEFSVKRVNDTIKKVERSQKGIIKIKTARRYKVNNTSQLDEVITDKIAFL